MTEREGKANIADSSKDDNYYTIDNDRNKLKELLDDLRMEQQETM